MKMSTTVTASKSKQAGSARDNDDEEFLREIKVKDNTCAFPPCNTRIVNFSIDCKHCQLKFCTTHYLPEVHGCGEAARRDEKREFLHPHPKLSEEKHEKVSQKLSTKLKQMQLERKAKQFSAKGKKK